MLVLGGVIVTCLLVAALCVCKSCVVFLFGSGDFGMCCCFPFVHSARDLVPVQCLAMDPLAQAFSEAYNGSLSVECPTSCECKSLEGGDVSDDVPSCHGEFHELVICVLLLGCVHPGVLEHPFELHPESFVIFAYVVWTGGVGACY